MAQKDAQLQLNIRQNREQVRENYFPTDRGLKRRTRQLPGKYRTSCLSVFGPYFFETLKSLGSSDTWLNVGGGELFAEVEYLTLGDFAGRSHAMIYTVSAESPATEDFRKNLSFLEETLGDRFVYMSGRRIEDIPFNELPKAGVVSDLYAAMGFSEHIDETLQRELDILAVGGALFTTMNKVFIHDAEGKRIGKRKYASMIRGAKLLGEKTRFETIILEKTDDPVTVPSVELVNFLSYQNTPNPKGLPENMLNCERHYVFHNNQVLNVFECK